MVHANIPSHSYLTCPRMFSNFQMLSPALICASASTHIVRTLSHNSHVLSLVTCVHSSPFSLKHQSLLPIKSSAIICPLTPSLQNIPLPTLKFAHPLSHHLAVTYCSSLFSPTCPLSGEPSPLLNSVLYLTPMTASCSHTLDSCLLPHLLEDIQIWTLLVMYTPETCHYCLKSLLLSTETPGLTFFETTLIQPLWILSPTSSHIQYSYQFLLSPMTTIPLVSFFYFCL